MTDATQKSAPQATPQNTAPCLICAKPFSPFTLGEEENYTFESCIFCGSVFANPRPTLETLASFFMEIDAVATHLPNPTNQIQRIRKAIGKTRVNPENMRFLDVCARQGYAVMAARQMGFQNPVGINFYKFYDDFAKDKYSQFGTFHHTALQDYAAQGHQADFIYANCTLGEQLDPDAFVATLVQLLAPNGVIYLREPDGNSPWLPNRFYRWQYCDPPVNFQYLSQKGLKSLLARHGLKRTRVIQRWFGTTVTWLLKKAG